MTRINQRNPGYRLFQNIPTAVKLNNYRLVRISRRNELADVLLLTSTAYKEDLHRVATILPIYLICTTSWENICEFKYGSLLGLFSLEN